MAIHKLTPRKVATAGPGKYEDGGGLRLVVSKKNAKHARQWVSTLKTYVRPRIGSKRVDAITTEDVPTILSPIWSTKTETAKRVQGRVENILDYAAAFKYHDALNPAR